MSSNIRVAQCAAAAVLALALGQARAEGAFEDVISELSFSFGGFVRAESAIRTTSMENPNNQGGNVTNGRSFQRTAYLPPNAIPAYLNGVTGGVLPALGVNLPQTGTWTSVPVGVLGYRDTEPFTRDSLVQTNENWTNYSVLRGETEFGVRYGSKLSLVGRLRGVYDPGMYDEFDAQSVANLQGGISGGDPRLYHGKPNYFDYIVEGGDKPNPLEWTGRNYQIYFPALVAEYSDGPLVVRAGNQQIAWGQSIFFRVFDVPNGLDLRRHLILDRALEEFSDKRVPMLSVRSTYQINDSILADAYVGKFQPSIFGNPNTGYNVIPAQFTVHDMFTEGGYDDELSYGLRLKGDYGTWGWQAMAVRRWNPDGVFRWTESGVTKPLPGGNNPLTGELGSLVNFLYETGSPGRAECGETTAEALAHTAFEVAPAGVYNAEEWFDYAGQVRLNGITGLNAAIDEFPCAQALFASSVNTYDEAYNELNTFFMGAGGSLRGHIAREYFQEDVFGLGVSYVTESDSSEFLNQLIFNLEVQYTPERTFTNTSLSRNYIKQDEFMVSLVADKWHRFFNEFPGTYIVMQALHKNRSDLVGRHLSGYGGDEKNIADGVKGGANYLVFGFLQPWPNKLYELEFAALYDINGGLFVQPGLRWNPGKGVTVEGFYNYIDGNLYGKPNDNLVSTLDFAEEFTLRLSYQF
ncbi:hypothetical protein D0B54_21350 [Solimonas sp. K1W22B-7]|uniref:DUF1302 family protein n=1 Tax=Solimonas sp. K1W22B-7 TaxID=2303331 RepID=UPI000E333572|nr:DUF1302 family protein [Solimonas sp. K1W22B-7]AXQ31068.1 hypothetical protein D0B54_21350 [Solimonas sp. K1W22B-7]